MRAESIRPRSNLSAPASRRDGPAPPGPRVVALGGGTGLPAVLRGLKEAIFATADRGRSGGERDRVTAIVTVADDGGSSGRLRRAYRVPAPGDARNCLVALSEAGTLTQIFGTRFPGNGDVGGHSLGNLILTALHEREGDFCRAVERAARLLRVCGRVIPCTRDEVTLWAEFEDGTSVHGESKIAMVRRRIRRLHLRPEAAEAVPPALAAIAAADLVVLGPGSLYTSLLPVLLVRGIADAIARSGARVALVANLMTEPGETDGYAVSDLVQAIRRHVPHLPIHVVLLNQTPIAAGALRRYAAIGSFPIAVDGQALRRLGCGVALDDLLGSGSMVRHDPARLGRALLELAAGPRTPALNVFEDDHAGIPVALRGLASR